MKKAISMLLILLMLGALLPSFALAAEGSAVLSSQGLRVDGRRAGCEAYSIEGSVYYKLRDIALLLRATGSRFSVEWDSEARAVRVSTGENYEPDGSELDWSGGDQSATAVPSSQTLLIDGVERDDLPAWNIGGNNYFRLEDLGAALGFQTDYDEASDTAILRSRAYYAAPTEWLTQELIFTDSTGAYHHEIYTYDGDGRVLTNLSEGVSMLPGIPEGVEFRSTTYFHYDELGRRTEYLLDHENGEGPRVASTFEYDVWGQLIRNGGGEENPGSYTTFTYDDDGNLTAAEQVLETPIGVWTTGQYMEYDGKGNRTRLVSVRDGETVSQNEYTYDAEGQLLREESRDAAGSLLSATDYDYENGRQVRSTRDYGSYSAVTSYDYDEAGRLRAAVTESPDGSTTVLYTWNSEGKPLRQETVNGDGSSTVTVWSYDEAGRLLRQVTGDPEAPEALTACTYDKAGRLLSEIYEESGGYRVENTYEYDEVRHKMTHTRTTTYPEASETALTAEG